MALDLIKQYLIGLGFKVDSASISDAEQSIGTAEKKIKNFNDKSNKGFSETNDSMKGLFSLLGSSKNIGKLLPELQKPFGGLIRDIITAKKLYDEFNSKVKTNSKQNNTSNKKSYKTYTKSNVNPKKQKSTKKKTKNKTVTTKGDKYNQEDLDKTIPDFNLNSLTKNTLKSKKNISKFKQSSVNSLKEVEASSKSLAKNGGKSLAGFSLKAAAHIGAIVVAVAVALLAIKKLAGFLNNLGNKDIEYEKLSRQLWTTKENARDIDIALKTLGVTMKDLWLSPTLLKQFNQLRSDSQKLRLPPEFKDNIKIVQGLGLEFKRLKQLGSLAFQWIGNYILKYLAGPLAEFKQKLNSFNNKFIRAIPHIAKVIGSAIGIILRLLLLIFRVLNPIFSIISKVVNFVLRLIDKIPAPLKRILKIIGVISALILSGPLGAIILVLGALDDLFTFFRGGKSIIGSVFGSLKERASSAVESVKNKFGNLKSSFREGMESLKDGWNTYWDKASDTLDKLKSKAKKVWGHITEHAKNIWDKTKDKAKEFFGDVGPKKIEVYNKDIAHQSAKPAKYLTRESNSTTTSNSNNKISNDNKIYVYGSDSKSTANTIDKKIKGINTRNLRGVY